MSCFLLLDWHNNNDIIMNTYLNISLLPSPGRVVKPVGVSVLIWSSSAPGPHTARGPAHGARHTRPLCSSGRRGRPQHWGDREGYSSQCIQWLREQRQASHVWRLLDTDLCLDSRDQPSLGPAVARTPPLLNSVSASSRLKDVEWLRFSLQECHSINDRSSKESYDITLDRADTPYLPKNFMKPLDFFLVSGEQGRASWGFLGGTPARSRWSVPLRSVSAVKNNHKKYLNQIRVYSRTTTDAPLRHNVNKLKEI